MKLTADTGQEIELQTEVDIPEDHYITDAVLAFQTQNPTNGEEGIFTIAATPHTPWVTQLGLAHATLTIITNPEDED